MFRAGHKVLHGRIDPRLAVNIPDWLTTEDYIVDDCVFESGVLYRCNANHTSSALFATDSANWDAVGSVAGVTSVNGETGVVVLTEEEVIGTAAEDLTLTGAENISLDTNVDMYLKLTGNTTITFTDTPSVGTSIVRTYSVESSVAETLGISNSTDEFGTYAANTTINEMVVKASNYTTEGLIIRVFFSQPN